MFEKLSLKSRLLLIATVPITVILILGISRAWEKYSDYQSRVQAETLVGLVVDLGETAHELQKERGMSSGFLNSKGSKFAENLMAQRKTSDAAITRLTDSIRRIDRTTVGPRYIKLLDAANEPFSELVKSASKYHVFRSSLESHSASTARRFRNCWKSRCVPGTRCRRRNCHACRMPSRLCCS